MHAVLVAGKCGTLHLQGKGLTKAVKPHGTRRNDSDINDDCIFFLNGSNLSSCHNLVGVQTHETL